jgi:uncharacterized membrane protein
VTVAVAYATPTRGFVSEGWWTLQACKCEVLVLSRETSDPHNVYVHGHAGNQRWEGGSRFCTRNAAFKIVGDENCEARGLKTTAFQHVKAPDVNHTTHLKKDGSGIVCPEYREPTYQPQPQPKRPPGKFADN